MSEVIIFYHSEHHGNTKKLAEAIAKAHGADLCALPTERMPDLKNYKVIGFASGIYMSKMHKSLFDALEDGALPKPGTKVFVLYTSGSVGASTASFEKKLKEKESKLIGIYGCRGFDTFGPFKIVGGIAKGHPNDEDIAGAVRFYEKKVLPEL